MQNNNLKPKTDLKKRAYVFSLNAIKFIGLLDKSNFTIQILSKQLLRAATSIGANVIEAQAGSTKKDFTNFFAYALKSANETKFWLGLFRDSGLADQGVANNMLQEATELANILASSILTLKGKK